MICTRHSKFVPDDAKLRRRNDGGKRGPCLDELGEHVGEGGGDGEEEDEDPVVEEGGVLRHEAVHPQLVAAQRLHYLQVVQLVPLLRKVHLHGRPCHLCTHTSGAPARLHANGWSKRGSEAVVTLFVHSK